MPQKFVIGHQHRDPNRIRMDGAEPFKISGIYCRLIPLTQRQLAIVLASDYEWLNQWFWYAWWHPDMGSYYAYRSIPTGTPGKTYEYSMHRQILGLEPGDKRLGDHINGNTLDNRRGRAPEGNLRIANRLQNGANCGISSNNKSGLKGVFWDKRMKRWVAKIQVNYLVIILGYFKTKEEAYAAYCAAARHHFGEFARL
jgi:AP2 domain